MQQCYGWSLWGMGPARHVFPQVKVTGSTSPSGFNGLYLENTKDVGKRMEKRTNISPWKVAVKMIFLFRWDMLVSQEGKEGNQFVVNACECLLYQDQRW